MAAPPGVFECRDRDGLARICSLHTPHGTVETPALMPVVNPNKVAIPPAELKSEFGAGIVITNSYIISRSHREEALQKGVHSLIGFDGPVMTDSGAFQLFTYGEIDADPREIVQFEDKIGVDIGTMLDIPSPPDVTHEKARQDVEITLQRAREAAAAKGKMLLAVTVQGAVYPDLRTLCAQSLSETCADYYTIGGVVPLMESYRYRELAEVIIASKKGLQPGVPVHLFGAGHPMVFPLAVLLGCDLFDSASYAIYARGGRMMFDWGTRHLKDLSWLPCDCPVCSSYTAQELKDSPDRENLLARHNLHSSFSMIRRVRQAVAEGALWELVEEHSRCHPALLEALKSLKGHADYLGGFEPQSRGRMFYCGPETMDRPAIRSYRRKVMQRYRQPEADIMVCFPENKRPYGERYAAEIGQVRAIADARFVVASPIGPVPIDLDEVYPACQSVFPPVESLDETAAKSMNAAMEQFSHGLKTKSSVCWEGESSLDFIRTYVSRKNERPPTEHSLDLARACAVADFQFGPGASEALLSGTVEFVKSKNTGRIRNVISGGEHVLSMRAEDGFYTLKIAGARRLHGAFPAPALRVVAHDDAAPFLLQGRNLMAKFVADCSPGIRPREEVLVVDSKDNLLAAGQALLVRGEMLSFRKGIAVHVREGAGAKEPPAG